MSSKGILDLRGNRSRNLSGQRGLFSAPSGGSFSSKRPTPLRVRRRRNRLLILFAILAIVGGILFGVHWVSYMPQFTIQSVSVVGAQDVSAQDVSAYVQKILQSNSYAFISHANIFHYPKAKIEQDVVTEFPRIKTAQAARPSILSTTLNIFIEERAPFAIWCEGDRCFQMDRIGFIFADVPIAASTTATYIFRGGIASSTPLGQTFAPSHLDGLIALLTDLGQFGFEPTGASIQNDQDFDVPLKGGYFLKASFGENADQLVKNLQLVLSSDALKGKQSTLEYVDLRFGNRVYYKTVGQNEATSTPQ